MLPSERTYRGRNHRGFTLIELLVVIAIIALLMAVLLPGLSAAKQTAQKIVCSTNFHQLGIGLTTYLNAGRQEYPFAGGETQYDRWWNMFDWATSEKPLVTSSFKNKNDVSAAWAMAISESQFMAQAFENKNKIFDCPTQKEDWLLDYAYNDNFGYKDGRFFHDGPGPNGARIGGYYEPLKVSKVKMPGTRVIITEATFPVYFWSESPLYGTRTKDYIAQNVCDQFMVGNIDPTNNYAAAKNEVVQGWTCDERIGLHRGGTINFLYADGHTGSVKSMEVEDPYQFWPWKRR